MNVSLTPEHEKLIQDQIKRGRFTCASEVIRAALCLLEERERSQQLRLEDLRKAVRVGLEQADAGDLAPWNTGEIRAEGARKLTEERKGP
jgi:antitoxin ParD1/3/4